MTLEKSAVRIAGYLYEEQYKNTKTYAGRGWGQARVVSCAISTKLYDFDKA